MHLAKNEFHTTSKPKERCILVGLKCKESRTLGDSDDLSELAELSKTAGAEVKRKVIQERDNPDGTYFVGKGKAEELANLIKEENLDVAIFDDELSPTQVKNLENLFNIKVLDRSGLILDIFAAHAKTREARLQVELAQLKYYLPRLTNQWFHLSRQVGGIGTKGPGETQLETDKRLVRKRIYQLERSLEKVRKQKIVQSKKTRDYTHIAIVGYTNAGKSTLMNALTKSNTNVENKLFATLDTISRRFELAKGLNILLSDTVGFINKIPHQLIASFQTTLSQAINADILLHVVDSSDKNCEQHINIVHKILKELAITKVPLLIMNKVDRVKDTHTITTLRHKFPDAIFVSALKNIRVDRLKAIICERILSEHQDLEIYIVYNKSEYKINMLKTFTEVVEIVYLENRIKLRLRFLAKYYKKVNKILFS